MTQRGPPSLDNEVVTPGSSSLPPSPSAASVDNPFEDKIGGSGDGNDSAPVAQTGFSPIVDSQGPPRRSSVEKHTSRPASQHAPSIGPGYGDAAEDGIDEKASLKTAEDAKSVKAEGEEGKEEEDRKSTDSAPAPELKHVPIDLPPDLTDDTESGWATVARSIRDIDEQKIKDYKEDIDTILVFAGLYSAVLSALLAESYQSLQPDPNTIMIALLGQIVVQTHAYSINEGYLNSTATPFDPTSLTAFTPSLAAKRVNVLWFASLTLSLISASFGILVKQWLREYLSGEYVSPQAQLRIRHFRTPGLEHWHVFAIAAFLPLVLQLALALFFVGLCFFTLDIHQSIGYTTVPLVAAWALLFVALSFAPSLSPRCPYKIPVFKDAMPLVRAVMFRVIRVFKGMPTLPPKTEWKIKPYWTWLSLQYNEEDAAKDPQSDVDILVSVDASQNDDQLVMKMCSALKEKHTTPEVMVDFVLRLIAFRLQTKFETRPLPLMLDLSQLPVQTSTILMDTIADVLSREVRKFPVSEPIEWTDLTRDCVSLLSARLPCLLSDKAMAVVSLCFAGTQSPRSEGTFALMFTSVHPKERHALCLHLQERVRNAFLHLNAWQFLDTLYIMMKKSCCTCSDCNTIEAVLKAHADTIPSVLRQHTCDVMTGYMLNQVKIGAAWSEWHREITLILCKQWAGAEKVSWHGALKELIRILLTKPKFAPYFYRHLFHKSEFETAAETIFGDTFPSSTEKQQIIINMYNVFTTYLLEMLKMPALLDDYFYLNILWFVDGQFSPMTYVVNNNDRSITENRYLPLYQMMWKMMLSVFRYFDPVTMTGKQTTWAKTCLEKIDTLDEVWLSPTQIEADANEEFEKWCKVFPAAKSFFDDDVIEGLMKFLPSLEDVQYKRVRRILWKREQRRTSQLEKEKLEDQCDEDKVNGTEAEADDSNAAAQDEAEHADALTDNASSPVIVPPSVWGETPMVAVVNTDGSDFNLFAPNNSVVAVPATLGHDIVPQVLETGQLIQVGRQGFAVPITPGHDIVPRALETGQLIQGGLQGLMVRGDTERTLVGSPSGEGVAADPGGSEAQIPRVRS